MRQDHDIKRSIRPADPVSASDDFRQNRASDQLLCGKRSDGDDQFRREQPDLPVEMSGTVGDLLRIRNAIASPFLLSRKAADDGAHVHAIAELLFGHSQPAKPAEHPPAGRISERTPILYLMRSRRLTDQHQSSARDGAGDGLSKDIRTCAAGVQALEMLCELRRSIQCNLIQNPAAATTIVMNAIPTNASAFFGTTGLLISGRAAGSPAGGDLARRFPRGAAEPVSGSSSSPLIIGCELLRRRRAPVSRWALTEKQGVNP